MHPTLGQLMRNLRARKSWTLKEMSHRIGIPVSTLCKVEHDRLSLTYDKLVQVSDAMQIPLAELFGGAPAVPDSDCYMVLVVWSGKP